MLRGWLQCKYLQSWKGKLCHHRGVICRLNWGDIYLLLDGLGELGPNPRAGQFSLPPTHLPPARHWAPKHTRLKELLFLEWPNHLPRAQQPPRDFYGLKGNLPVIPSAATGLEPPQHNKSFKEQSAFILGEKICVKTLSVLHFLSPSPFLLLEQEAGWTSII